MRECFVTSLLHFELILMTNSDAGSVAVVFICRLASFLKCLAVSCKLELIDWSIDFSIARCNGKSTITRGKVSNSQKLEDVSKKIKDKRFYNCFLYSTFNLSRTSFFVFSYKANTRRMGKNHIDLLTMRDSSSVRSLCVKTFNAKVHII